MTTHSNQLLNPVQGNNHHLLWESEETTNTICLQNTRFFMSKNAAHPVKPPYSEEWCVKSVVPETAKKYISKLQFISLLFALRSVTTWDVHTNMWGVGIPQSVQATGLLAGQPTNCGSIPAGDKRFIASPKRPQQLLSRDKSLKADSHIACRSHDAPLQFPSHAVPLRV